MDSQRAKAAKLVDSDVLTLGKESQRTRKTTNPVTQANMSRFGAASPQPRLTPTSIPFKKGGSSAGKMKKAAAVAGLLSALTQPQGGPAPAGMGAPPAPPMAGPPMGAPPGPGMRRGGRYAKGGKVHGDEAEDKVLFKRMFKQEESKEAKMKRGGRAMGGRITDDEGNEERGMKRGGATHVPMKGAGNRKPDSGTGGNLVPRNKMARGGHAKPKEGSAAEERTESKRFEAREDRGMAKGGKCMKCGGMAHGGACMKKGGRSHFAMGGVAKIRKGVADKAGKPIAQKRHSYEDSLI